MDDNREVIGLVDKIRGYQSSTGCDEIEIELPQIVVVGAQSSGKSSVLDGLMGSSILPRGSNTVTKCPIIVKLINITDPSEEEEGVEFEDVPEVGRIGVNEYDKARDLITELMEQRGGEIRDEPVTLQVFSPNVVTLTVIDLPGIKRLNNANEPHDLENQTRKLSRKYIDQKNAIILAVSPANYDICNSDGIALAKKADPNGDRTIGVLTKLDLMDEGTDARGLLTRTSKDAKLLPKLGMIGLVNRSQRDIENNLSVEDQLEKEKVFLNENYPDLAAVNGVPFLRKRLHELLVQHILKCLPEIQANIEKILEECQARIKVIPDVTTPTDKFRFVSRIIQEFENCMKKEIEGCTRNPDYLHLYGGIRIKDIFDKKFAHDMDTAGRKSNESVNDNMILNAFRNSGGFDSFFVYPDAVFRKLAQEQIKHIEKPALKCAERVHDEIIKIADRYLKDQKKVLDFFPEFKRSLKSVVHKMLNDKLDKLKKLIKDYIRTQASVVFSLDDGFRDKISKIRRNLEKNLNDNPSNDSDEDGDGGQVGGGEKGLSKSNVSFNFKATGADSPKPSLKPRSKFTSTSNDPRITKLKDPNTTRLIKDMVSLYFNHVKKQIEDYVPKLVADRLITQFSSDQEGNLGTELQVQVLRNFEEIAKLPANVSEKRAKDVKLKEHLKEVISEIKGILNAHEYDDESGYAEQEEGPSGDEDEDL